MAALILISAGGVAMGDAPAAAIGALLVELARQDTGALVILLGLVVAMAAGRVVFTFRRGGQRPHSPR